MNDEAIHIPARKKQQTGAQMAVKVRTFIVLVVEQMEISLLLQKSFMEFLSKTLF